MQEEPLNPLQFIADGYGVKRGVEESMSKCKCVIYIGFVVEKEYGTGRKGGGCKESI